MASSRSTKALRVAHRVERTVLWVLLGSLLLVAILATAQMLVDIIGVSLTLEGNIFLSADEVFFIFEAVFLVLIALELLETVLVYLKENVFHVEAVVLVALTAIARKIIVLSLDKYDWGAVAALGLLVAALAGGYYVLRRTKHMTCPWEDEVNP